MGFIAYMGLHLLFSSLPLWINFGRPLLSLQASNPISPPPPPAPNALRSQHCLPLVRRFSLLSSLIPPRSISHAAAFELSINLRIQVSLSLFPLQLIEGAFFRRKIQLISLLLAACIASVLRSVIVLS